MSKLQSRRHETVPGDHFEALYTHKPDPWDYQTSAFEANKRSKTIDALDDRTFQAGIELGSSIGVLTNDLAPHCETLVAVDGSPLACALARKRLADLHNVEILQARFPDDLDKLVGLGPRDLIVLSEVLYFFSSADMTILANYVCKALTDNGLCLVVNFDGDTQSGFSGVEANELFAQLTTATLEQVTLQTYDGFQIATYRPKMQAKE
jgi:predicted TPR repeat methyltransferase